MLTLRLEVPSCTVTEQCTMDEPIRDSCLHFSAFPTASICGEEVQTNHSHPNSSGSHMGLPTMVLHPTQIISSPSREAHQQSKPWEHRTPRSQTTSDLSPEVLEFGYSNLSSECMDIFREARHPTTRTWYAAKWKRFVCYCTIYSTLTPLTVQFKMYYVIYHIFKGQV